MDGDIAWGQVNGLKGYEKNKNENNEQSTPTTSYRINSSCSDLIREYITFCARGGTPGGGGNANRHVDLFREAVAGEARNPPKPVTVVTT